MRSKSKKLIDFVKTVLKEPSLINIILSNNDVQQKKFLQKYQNFIALPQIEIKDLGGENVQQVTSFFLDGASLISDLQLLSTIANRDDVNSYFEIGTWRGESVYNVAGIIDNCTTLNLSEKEITDLGFNRKYAEQHGLLSKKNPKILHLHGNTKNYAFAGLNKKYDLIFIDGDHTYDMVKNDTEKVFQHLVHENSIVVWHDYAYSPQRIRYEVFRAILDGLKKENHQFLYHPKNTMCAVFYKGEIKSTAFDDMLLPDKIFEVTIKEKSFPF